MPSPLPEIHEGSVQYCFERGLLVPILRWSDVRADPVVCKRIGQLYTAAPEFDDNALPAYRALRAQIWQQFELLTKPVAKGGLGVTVRTQAEEPYSTVGELITELRECRQVRIISSSAIYYTHPFFTFNESDMLRSLFEVFGHATIGAGFGIRGEEAAWLRHSVMFSPLARQAMTTETRGRLCALFYAPTGTSLPKPKAMVLPPEFSEPDYEVWR